MRCHTCGTQIAMGFERDEDGHMRCLDCIHTPHMSREIASTQSPQCESCGNTKALSYHPTKDGVICICCKQKRELDQSSAWMRELDRIFANPDFLSALDLDLGEKSLSC